MWILCSCCVDIIWFYCSSLNLLKYFYFLAVLPDCATEDPVHHGSTLSRKWMAWEENQNGWRSHLALYMFFFHFQCWMPWGCSCYAHIAGAHTQYTVQYISPGSTRSPSCAFFAFEAVYESRCHLECIYFYLQYPICVGRSSPVVRDWSGCVCLAVQKALVFQENFRREISSATQLDCQVLSMKVERLLPPLGVRIFCRSQDPTVKIHAYDL
jgi:hypothetical protein